MSAKNLLIPDSCHIIIRPPLSHYLRKHKTQTKHILLSDQLVRPVLPSPLCCTLCHNHCKVFVEKKTRLSNLFVRPVHPARSSGVFVRCVRPVRSSGAFVRTGSYTYFSNFLARAIDSLTSRFDDKSCRNLPKVRRNKYISEFVVQNSN
jgi:hypothetical protein